VEKIRKKANMEIAMDMVRGINGLVVMACSQ
jgi:hypothetical protein